MKNLKNLGLALALLFSISLAGCKFNKSSSSASSEPEISEPGTSEGGSSEGGSSEGGSSEGGSSGEEVVAKTAEEVVADINAIFNPLVGSDIMDWYEDYACYIGGLNLGAAEASAEDAEAHQAELQEATEFVASYLPEYLEASAAGYETDYDDYYIGLGVDEVEVDLFGYVNGSGNVIVQIQVA